MTEAQRGALRHLLHHGAGEFHHGDCVGADAEAHDMALALDLEVVIHPPLNSATRAWKNSHHIHKPKGFLARNRDIVRDTDVLIATPAEGIEQHRSGTWSTVRFARKVGRDIWIVLPDGQIREEGPWSARPEEL
jgi:hypothetical protein